MTDAEWKEMTWYQYGAAIDMLADAINVCPEALWREPLWVEDSHLIGSSQFWYVAYHCIFWTDYYLSESAETFEPPAPFTLSEFDPAGALPDRVYSRDELETYLAYVRAKCRTYIETLDDPKAVQQMRRNWIDMSVAELLIYSMRHVMEHQANLTTFLGQHSVHGTKWHSRPKN